MGHLLPPLALLLVTACRPDDPTAPPSPESTTSTTTGITGDTGTVTPPTVQCAATDHALRATCSWSHVSEPLELRVHDLAQPIAGTDTLSITHLQPDTSYDWEVAGHPELAGRFTTPPLPDGVQLNVVVQGELSTPLLGMRTPCDTDQYVVVVDPHAEQPVVGYEAIESTQRGILEGVSFTEDHTVLALSGFPAGLLELTPGGDVVSQLTFEDFEGTPHHDSFRQGGLTYVLVQEFVEDVFFDAVEVFDPDGVRVASWHLADHLDPQPRPSGIIDGDYSHANSIWLDEAGDWYLSLRHLSSVVKVAGLQATDAGAIRWIVVGDPDETRVQGTFPLIGDASFVHQHNAHLTPDGRLALFDNRRAFPELSRMVWLDVDEASGEVREASSWTLPWHCPFQGGAWSTPSGNALATCAPRQTALEYTPGQVDPVGSVEITCATGGNTYIPRMVPLQSW